MQVSKYLVGTLYLHLYGTEVKNLKIALAALVARGIPIKKCGAVALNSAAVPFSCTFFEAVLM